MNNGNGQDLSEILKDREGIRQAMGEAVMHAIWVHGRLGNPIATWEDGKVVVRHVTQEEMRRCEAVLGITNPDTRIDPESSTS